MIKIQEFQKQTLSQAYVLHKISQMDKGKVNEKSSAWDDVEPWVNTLAGKGYVKFKEKGIFGNANISLTKQGQAIVEAFQHRYQNLIKATEIYSAIDLEAGSFAWEYWLEDDPTQEEFTSIMNEPHWEDLRVPILQNMGLDPIEAIFIQKLQDEELNSDDPENWGFDLLVDEFWNEIEEIANSQIKIEDLALEEESGEDIINNILQRGEEVMKDLLGHTRGKIFKKVDPADNINWNDTVTPQDMKDWTRTFEL